MKLTLIGNGTMADAMIEGLLKSSHEIEVFGRDIKKLETLNKKYNNKLEIFALKDKIDIQNKVLILCVKPYALQNVSSYFFGEAKMLISVLAKTQILELKENINAQEYIRVMPNIAAKFSKSMSTLTGSKTSQDEVVKIFSAIGKTLWVDTEQEFDIASLLAGSGAAFLALVAESLTDGAVKAGLKRVDASYLVNGMFEGFYELLNNYSHPALIKDAIMSPGGVTARGIKILEENKVRSSFINIF